jgi:hypothetical protein
MRASSVSVAARLLLTTSLCLAGSGLWLTPAEAQFVRVGNPMVMAAIRLAGVAQMRPAAARTILPAVKAPIRMEPSARTLL